MLCLCVGGASPARLVFVGHIFCADEKNLPRFSFSHTIRSMAANPRPRPTGATAIAILLFAVAAYLGTVGTIMLASPGTVSMAAGASLLNGLELAGPYMFLLVAVLTALTGWGMLRMQRWARRVTILAAFAGFVMLIPSVSAAAVDFRWSLVTGGLGIIVRMVVVWYLWQTPVAEQFSKLFAKKSKGD